MSYPPRKMIFRPVERVPFLRNHLDHHMQEVVSGASVALIMKVVGAGIAFGFNVLLARLAGAEGAGLYYIAFSAVTIATIFGRMGLDTSLVRFIAANASLGHWDNVKGVHKKSLTIALIASAVSFLFVFIYSSWIAETLFSKPELGIILRWMSLSIMPVTLLALYGAMLKGLKRIFYFSLAGQNGLLIALLSLLGLYSLGRFGGVKAAAWSYVIASTFTAIISFFLWRTATPQLTGIKGQFKTSELLSSSMPLFWVASMNLIMNWTATFSLGIWSTASETGIFSMASRTAMSTSFILLAVNSIVAPKFAALYAKGDMKALADTARNSAKLMALVSGPILLLFTVVPGWVMGLFGEKFVVGAGALTILSIGQFVNVVTGSVGCLLMMSCNEKLMRNNVIFSAFLTLLLNLILVPRYGMYGAAYATAISLSCQNIFAVILVKRTLKINAMFNFN